METQNLSRSSPSAVFDAHRITTSEINFADLTQALIRTLAAENHRLHEALVHECIRDCVTDLFTRRYLEESLESDLARLRLRQGVLSLALFRLDHLTAFESECGRAATDILLKAVSYVVTSNVRADDTCCRYGADEFAVAMFEAPLFAAHKRADSLRENIKTIEWCNNSRLSTGVTLSVGVASFPEHATTVASLVEAAHAALRRSVDNGRDRVSVACRTVVAAENDR